MKAVSLVALGASFLGAVVAFSTWAGLCLEDAGGSTMCPDSQPSLTMNAQLWMGVAGFVGPAVFVWFAFGGERRKARIALALSVAWWVAWAFLNDASVHTWGSSMRLIP